MISSGDFLMKNGPRNIRICLLRASKYLIIFKEIPDIAEDVEEGSFEEYGAHFVG